MKKMKHLLFPLAIMLLAGCAADSEQPSEEHNQKEQTMDEQPQMLEANILVPKMINPNEEVTLKVEVTQGDEKVEDANEVMFEIWQDDKEKSEMIEAEHEGNGVYTIKTTFEQDGVYHVQTHVTARDLHVMPTIQVAVGEVSEDEMNKMNMDKEHQDHEGHGGDHNH